MSFLLTPLSYEFMQRGMIAAVLVGIICAVVGTFVVLRGMAFFGDALAHTILPGIALGYLVSGGAREPLFWWALGTAVVASLGIGAISKNSQIKEDTAIGIIFAGHVRARHRAHFHCPQLRRGFESLPIWRRAVRFGSKFVADSPLRRDRPLHHFRLLQGIHHAVV